MLIDVPLTGDSIRRHSHNLSTFPNDCRFPINRQSLMRAYWRCLQAQSRRPAILVVYQCNLICVPCYSSHLATFRIKLWKLWALQLKERKITKTGFVNRRTAIRRPFVEPTDVY
jgi:hypothetical protein